MPNTKCCDPIRRDVDVDVDIDAYVPRTGPTRHSSGGRQGAVVRTSPRVDERARKKDVASPADSEIKSRPSLPVLVLIRVARVVAESTILKTAGEKRIIDKIEKSIG